MTATLTRPGWTTSVPPRFSHVPVFSSSAGQDCVDLAAAAGLELDPWQRDVLVNAMAKGPNGKWSTMRVGLIVPRQNGKGGILEALELFHLYMVKSTDLITHTAHRFDTCLDHFRRVRKLIEDTPALLELVEDNGRGVNGAPSGIKDSNGKESIKLRKRNGRPGSKLNFKAREKGSGRGFSGDLVVLDEAFWLKDLSGLIPTMSARENPQVWYTSSAPLPRMESDRLRNLVREGRALSEGSSAGRTEGRLTYIEWSLPKDADLDDFTELAKANPSTEVGRITEEFTYEVERVDLTEDEFARERGGIFPDEDEAPRWEFVTEGNWAECASTETPRKAAQPGWLTGPVTLAIERSRDLSSTHVLVAGECREGGIGVDVFAQRDELASREGLPDWVAPLLVQVKPDVARFVVDKGSAAESLLNDLRAVGIEPELIDTPRLMAGTGAFIDATAAGTVKHRDRPELTASISKAEMKDYGDARLIDRKSEGDPAIAIGVVLAHLAHVEASKPRPRVFNLNDYLEDE